MHDIFQSNKDPARIDWSISEFLSNMSPSAQARTHLQKAFINCGRYLVRLNFAHQSMASRMLDPIMLNQTNMRKSKKKKKRRAERTDCTCYIGNSLVQLTQTKNTSLKVRMGRLNLLLLLRKIPVKRGRVSAFFYYMSKTFYRAQKLHSVPLRVSSLNINQRKTPFKVAPCWRDPKAMFPICQILARDF